MSDRITGERKCIDGKEYEYITRTNGTRTNNDQTSSASLLDQILTVLKAFASLFGYENSYEGQYRNIVDFPIKANTTNFPINIGFPVRLFYLTTAYAITLRLGTNVNGDPINLTSVSSPFELQDLPHGLAFDTILVTNPSSSDIAITIFAMG